MRVYGVHPVVSSAVRSWAAARQGSFEAELNKYLEPTLASRRRDRVQRENGERESGENIAELCFSKTTPALKFREFSKRQAAPSRFAMQGGVCKAQPRFSSEINLSVTEP
jgi:hypothetical protein